MKESIGSIKSGLIWITGFSASGKTTVARKVYYELSTLGLKVIHLDGDDLRGIFGNHWGFDRESRVELAHSYIRLCSHLASQNYIVILSAVAMFDPIKSWASDNISNVVQVYLEVPIEKRIERDKKTKNIYKEGSLSDSYYDIPKFADLTVHNYGGVSPTTTSKEIVNFFLDKCGSVSDNGRTQYWNEFYKNAAPSLESPFASFVNEKILDRQTMLEVGCGNGRDSQFFARNNHNVIAIDRSDSAIVQCRSSYPELNIRFECGLISDISNLCNIDVVYSRFVIHAMPLQEELDLIDEVHRVLKKGGLFFIECRSINDDMFRDGEILSPTERINGHYRRFIILDELVERLENVGLKVTYQIEDRGLAIHRSEDPVVIRVIAEKR